MTSRDEIIAFCDDTLDADAFEDYGPNGLQVPGRGEVTRVATCVSAHLESIERAIALEADLLIAHHGLFWDFHPRALTVPMAARLRAALGAGLNLAGYHLPLDAHRQIGNNALICETLGLALSPEPFGRAKGAAIGAIGRSDDGIPAAELLARVRSRINADALCFETGPDTVRAVGILSGAGASAIAEAVASRLDAVITGEPAEHAMADAREGSVHFVAAGHYATETFGIRRLGELVAERFGVEHHFIDVPNPI
ncbi:MAG: Nif3-like dinuclear metal center hexameric protein [Actinomycetota bacterium]|nr:Nif3-like dinuclear metal center hexameric protein [Actinomycetota bacterium]